MPTKKQYFRYAIKPSAIRMHHDKAKKVTFGMKTIVDSFEMKEKSLFCLCSRIVLKGNSRRRSLDTILLWLENVVLVKSPGRVALRHCGFGNDSRKLAVIWLLKKWNENDSKLGEKKLNNRLVKHMLLTLFLYTST